MKYVLPLFLILLFFAAWLTMIFAHHPDASAAFAIPCLLQIIALLTWYIFEEAK